MSSRFLLAVLLAVLGLTACDARSGTAPAGLASPEVTTPSPSAATAPARPPAPTSTAQEATPPPATAVPGVARPDPRLTPGDAFPDATVAQICIPGYAASVRHVTLEQYHEVYAEYGVPYPQPPGTYELDHLVSGGPLPDEG